MFKFACLLVLVASEFTMAFAPQSLPHSFARPDEAAIKHLDLDLTVDFKAKILSGQATLTLDRKPAAKAVVLDTRGLKIGKVSSADGQKLEWKLGEDKGAMGQSLTIELPAGVNKVAIEYATSPSAEALQWLSPEQTTDKKHPFLFTQSQAILARTWVPCQDTPAVRMTYSAKMKVPPALMAVMSASNPQVKNEEGQYSFEMKQAIPSYLLALAVGDLEFKNSGTRTGVYAEPSVLEKADRELEDTERMIVEAEKLYGCLLYTSDAADE